MVLCLFLLTVSGATAQKKETDEAGAKPEIKGYIPIQLLSLSIPIKGRSGSVGRGVMTIFPVVRGQRSVQKFCKYLPRVREAITIAVDQNPIPIFGEKQVFQEIETRLQGAINRVLPAPLVVRLNMFLVSRHMGQNAEILELPGTTGECMALKELPRDLEAILSKKKAEAKSSVVAVPKLSPGPKKFQPRNPAEDRSGSPAQPEIIVNKITIPLEKKTSASKGCRPLKKVWPEGYHNASGAVFWLGQVFSLDEDNDGAVDNVGFILRSEDRPDLYIYYFPGPGRQSVISVPSLRLEDDREVTKTCFGKVSYEKPEATIKITSPSIKVPVPARKTAIRVEGKKSAGAPQAVPNGPPDLTSGIGLVFVIAIGAGVVLIVGGGLGYVLARRKASRRRKERRRGKDQRQGDRRKKNVPPEEPDRRKAKERRGDNRRQEKDRSE